MDKNQNNGDKLIKTKKVLEQLDISKYILKRYRQEGLLHAIVQATNHHKYSQQEVQTLIGNLKIKSKFSNHRVELDISEEGENKILDEVFGCDFMAEIPGMD